MKIMAMAAALSSSVILATQPEFWVLTLNEIALAKDASLYVGVWLEANPIISTALTEAFCQAVDAPPGSVSNPLQNAEHSNLFVSFTLKTMKYLEEIDDYFEVNINSTREELSLMHESDKTDVKIITEEIPQD